MKTDHIDPYLAIMITVVVLSLTVVACLHPAAALPMIIPTLTTILAALRGKLIEKQPEPVEVVVAVKEIPNA